MIGFIIFIHAIVCVFLIVIILIQRGHGGGLVESLSGIDSMFGTKTSAFLTRFTTVLAILFLATCLTLAVISARQSKSLMRRVRPSEEIPVEASAPTEPEESTPSELVPGAVPLPETQPERETKPSVGGEEAQ